MNGAFYIGATGLDAQQKALDVVANNITNINTSGFKRAEVSFSELVGAPTRVASGDSVTFGPTELAGVTAGTPQRVFTQGTLQQTGSALDVAINGDGFIELLGPNGQTFLWRGGTLAIDANGQLTGPNGMVLKTSITIPQGATGLTIAADGTVSATAAGEAQASEIGKIELVTVRDMSTISEADSGLYKVAADEDLVSADPGTEGAGTIVQGSLEGSNVQLTDEMVSMLVIQRAYAASAQLVQAGDQLMAIANGLKR